MRTPYLTEQQTPTRAEVDALPGPVLVEFGTDGAVSSIDLVEAPVTRRLSEVRGDLAEVLGEMDLVVEGCGVVLAEPALLRLAILNLRKNAEKHGGGLVKFVIEPAQAGLWLWAYDAGPGFPAEVLPRAFEPFVKHGDGTGLGLAIVGAVAEVLEGKVRAENRAEGGARVGIWLAAGQDRRL